MTWYEQNRGHRVYAPDGSGLDRIYARKYRVVSDGDVALTAVSSDDPPTEHPSDTPAVDTAVRDEAPHLTHKERLVAECKAAGLPHSGTIAELEARLAEHTEDDDPE